jgi:GT2 family glycosyltransferase
MKMKFYFIAVNYNGFKFTCDYIESVCSIAIDNEDSVEIIIIDNDSAETEVLALESWCEKYDSVRLVKLNKNIGYFGGLNAGISLIDKDEDTILVIGNNDLTFSEDFLIKFKEINFDEDVLVLAPNITTKDGRQQNPHVVDSVSLVLKVKASIYYSNYVVGQTFRAMNVVFKKCFGKTKRLIIGCQEQRKIKRGIGACYLIMPRFFYFYDKLDDSVFLWGEEVLLSNQVEAVSGYTLYTPSLKITHHESASVTAIESRSRYKINRDSYKIYGKFL